MAKKNKIEIDVKVDDKGTTKKVALESKKASEALDKTGKSARTADRNLKGAAQASAGAGKNFAKLSQGAGGLVGAYAALAASLFAVSAAYNFLKRAGDLQALQTGQKAYASATGVALKSLTNDIIAATDAQITFRDAAQAAAIGTAAGLATDQLKQLGKAAKDASIVLGRDVTDSFNRLVRGVTKAEPELLDELGIILRLETATKAYAQQIGKSAKDLTAFERSQAVANDVLAQAEDKYGRILEVTGGSANEFAQLGKAFDDIVMQIQEVVSTVAGPLAKVFTETPALALASFGLLAKGPLKALGISFGDLAVSAEAAAEAATANLDEVKKKAALATNNVEALSKNFTGLGKSIKNAGASAKFLDKIKAGDALSGIDKANIKKSLNAAKLSVNEFGIVTKGVFKGVALSMVLEFEKGFLAVDAAEKGKLSRTKVWGAKMSSAYATAAAGVKTLAASLATGLNVLLGWLSWIGLAVTAFLALREQFGLFKQELTDAEKLYKRNAEKISDVVEELENFAAIQLILAEGNTTKGFAAIGNVFENFDKAQLQQLTEEIKNYSKAQKERLEYDERTAAMMEAQSVIQASLPGDKRALGPITLTQSLMAPEASKEAQKANDVITAVTDTLDGLESKFGVTSIAGNAFRKALEDLRNGVPGAEEAFEKAVGKVIEFGNAMEELPRLSAEANDAFGSFKQSLAPISQGQRAINALRLEIKNLEIAQRESTAPYILGQGPVRSDVSIKLDKSKKDLKFAETLETNQFKRQQEILKVKQMQEQVDLRRIPAEQNIYNLAGKIAEQYVQQQNIKGEIADINATATEDNRKLNDSENARIKTLELQSTILDAQIDGNKQRLQVAQDTLSIEQQLYNLQIDNKILSAEQEILKVAEKQLDIQQRLLAIRERRANLELEREMVAYERENPFAFLDQQRVEAEKRYELEKKLSKDKMAQIEAEKDLKLKMIDLEYALLDAKMLQTELELKALAERPEITAEQRTGILDTAGEVGRAREGLQTTKETAKQAVKGEAANAVLAIVTNLEKLELAKDNLSEMGQITDALSDSFGNGLVNAINGVITGSMNMKTAMLGMAKAVLQALAQVIAKLIAIKLLESAISFFGGGFGGAGGPGPQAGMTDFSSGLDIGAIARNGGIFEKASGYRYGGLVEKFAGGGIARGRDAGYPAILHGTEAVVPLPNGKEIPVKMMNGGQSNNVVVNVSIDNNGNAQQNGRADDAQGMNLGNAIAAAVQKEMQNQKRSGGILNPYGVA